MPQEIPVVVDPGTSMDEAVYESLGRVLDSGTEPERCLAAQALGRIGGTLAMQLLIDHLHDPDPDVRSDIAMALARIGDLRAIDPLIANLKEDPVGEIKIDYIKALKALDARESVPVLTVLATGRGELKGIDWEDVYTDWDDWLDVQRAAIEALGVIACPDTNGEQIEAIVTALNDPEGQDVWAIGTKALARLGKAGCVALDKLTTQASALNRKRIAKALSASENSLGEDLLVRLLRDKDVAVRIVVIESSTVLGLASLWRDGLTDEAPEVRVAALSGMIGLDREVIKTALDDTSAMVAIAACRSIENAGVPLDDLGLRTKTEKSLRTGSPEFLAALIAAVAVGEPAKAAELIEDIVNHRATDPLVRCASLRALGKLNTVNATDLLAEAVSDSRQDIRLEAIVALEKISTGEGASSSKAVALLASAISGTLVTAPPGWQPEDDEVVYSSQKKGMQVAREESDKNVLLDRDGNIVDRPVGTKEGDGPTAVDRDDEAAPEEIVVSSTLEAILDFQPAPASLKNSIEISEEDLSFLELTDARPGRRRMRPEANIAAHIDVRLMAARMAGGTGQAGLVPALVEAAADVDHELSQVAIESLLQLAVLGININQAEPVLLQQAETSNISLRCSAIEALSRLKSEAAAGIISNAVGDTAGAVRTAGVKAAARNGIDLDLRALIQDRNRAVRKAVATLIARRHPSDAVQTLLEFARVDGAVHKFEAADLLASFGPAPAKEVISWIDGSNRQKKLIGLEILPALQAVGRQKEVVLGNEQYS